MSSTATVEEAFTVFRAEMFPAILKKFRYVTSISIRNDSNNTSEVLSSNSDITFTCNYVTEFHSPPP